MIKKVKIRYFAKLREEAGVADEILSCEANTPKELYQELIRRYALTMPLSTLKVAINNHYTDMDKIISDGDEVIFIPPVAGG